MKNSNVIYRFMSTTEIMNFAKGLSLVNLTRHRDEHGRDSDAVGFSFGFGDENQAKKDFRRLNGIVAPSFLLVGEPVDMGKFVKCKARYCDYEKFDELYEDESECPLGEEPRRMYDELCITKYGKSTFKHFKIFQVHVTFAKDPFMLSLIAEI